MAAPPPVNATDPALHLIKQLPIYLYTKHSYRRKVAKTEFCSGEGDHGSFFSFVLQSFLSEIASLQCTKTGEKRILFRGGGSWLFFFHLSFKVSCQKSLPFSVQNMEVIGAAKSQSRVTTEIQPCFSGTLSKMTFQVYAAVHRYKFSVFLCTQEIKFC